MKYFTALLAFLLLLSYQSSHFTKNTLWWTYDGVSHYFVWGVD